MAKPLIARPPTDAREEAQVRRLAGARHAPADWIERARMVAYSWEGQNIGQIADRLGCHHKRVRRWLHRFNDQGVDGLGNQSGGGRRPRLTAADRAAIIELARSIPPGKVRCDEGGELAAWDEAGPPPEWTLDSLAAAARAQGIEVHPPTWMSAEHGQLAPPPGASRPVRSTRTTHPPPGHC